MTDQDRAIIQARADELKRAIAYERRHWPSQRIAGRG